LVCPFANAQTNQTYYLSAVPTPSGSSGVGQVFALDSNGEIVGNLYQGSSQQSVPAAWTKSAVRLFISPLQNGPQIYLSGANRTGGAVGSGVDITANTVNVFLDSSGKSSILPNNSALEPAYAVDHASDNGVITGSIGVSFSGYSTSQAAIWASPSATPTILPVTYSVDCNYGAANCTSSVLAISPNGRFVVGYYDEWPHGADFPILWIDGVRSAGGYGSGSEESATSVNDSGVIVGNYGGNPEAGAPYYYPPHAFRDSIHGGLVDLGTLPGGAMSYANSINASGVIVGSSSLANDYYDEHPHAVMWINDSIVDLNTKFASMLPSGAELNYGYFTNDAGQILLSGRNVKAADSPALYFIATPLIPTRISISSNINPSSYGQAIHLVASILPTSGAVALGQVSWYDNGKLLGTAGLTKIGTASWEPATWASGAHNVTVTYAGYSPDAGSTSSVFKQTIGATSTKTTLTTSVNPPTHGKAFTLTATVVPTYSTIAGSVAFKSGSTTLGTAAVDGRTKQGRFTATLKSAGKYSLTAVYSATTNFKSSTSSPLTLTVK
jgi:hypothetical protein